jgi:Putative restriction endonuclease
VVSVAVNAYRDAHPSRAALVVEIAETSYRIDRDQKFSLYARAGIAECWLLDVLNETIEVHRDPEQSPTALYGWRYHSVVALRPPAEVRPLIAPDTGIRVADPLP